MDPRIAIMRLPNGDGEYTLYLYNTRVNPPTYQTFRQGETLKWFCEGLENGKDVLIARMSSGDIFEETGNEVQAIELWEETFPESNILVMEGFTAQAEVFESAVGDFLDAELEELAEFIIEVAGIIMSEDTKARMEEAARARRALHKVNCKRYAVSDRREWALAHGGAADANSVASFKLSFNNSINKPSTGEPVTVTLLYWEIEDALTGQTIVKAPPKAPTPLQHMDTLSMVWYTESLVPGVAYPTSGMMIITLSNSRRFGIMTSFVGKVGPVTQQPEWYVWTGAASDPLPVDCLPKDWKKVAEPYQPWKYTEGGWNMIVSPSAGDISLTVEVTIQTAF